MKTNHKTTTYLRGSATHRRTQSDYLGAMLETVTLSDWRDVVAATVAAAKAGDAQARSWLASYLVGRPATEAPSALSVVASQVSGDDPLVAALARPAIERSKYPTTYSGDDSAKAIREQVAAELAERIGERAEDARPPLRAVP